MTLLVTKTCTSLPEVSPDVRKRIAGSERTSIGHRALFSEIEAMHYVERGGQAGRSDALTDNITVAAWNMERCLDPDASADLLGDYRPDIVLLSEMDCGMARTRQNHTTRDVAARLGMEYAYGVEFFELGLGGQSELQLATDDFNSLGWHGNAVLSSVPLSDVALVRLDDHGQWFIGLDGAHADQPRIGGRMAIIATVPTPDGFVCVASVHLESTGTGWWRMAQMERLISAIDAFAPDMPVVIGGDLNTGNNTPGGDWRSETLFAAAERRGFSWSNNADGYTNRHSRISSYPPAKLDWFAHRGCQGVGARIVPALSEAGIPLSDHELIVGRFELG